MKKIIKLFAASALLISLFFTGCDNPAFYGISQDVVSEDATVSGSISQITRYTASGTEFLIVNADGGLRYKRADNRTHGSWATYGALPFSLHSYDYYGESHNGEQIIKIVADTDYLYILSCTYKNDNDEGTVAPDVLRLRCAKITSTNGQTLDSAEWKLLDESTSGNASAKFKIYKYSSTGYYYSAFSLFSTNSVNPAHRTVFLRSGKYNAVNTSSDSAWRNVSYYQLKDGAISSYDISKIWAGSTLYADSNIKSNNINVYGAAYINNGLQFFNNPAVDTNETKTTDATFAYYGNGSYVHYLKSDATYGGSIGTSRSVSALAVCADSIIIGMGTWDASLGVSTYGGITKSNLSNGIPTGTTSFKTNAESQITSGYHVYALLNADPSETETASALYAAIGIAGTGSSSGVAYSSIGLWSYYPSRGNWNRE